VTDYVNATNGQTRGTSSVTQTVVLTSPPQLQVSINGPSNIKVNGTGVFTVSATGGVAPYTYAFAPKTYTGTQNGATYTISPTTLGTGTVIAVVTDSVGSKGTTSTASYTVTTSNTSNALAATIVGASSIPTNVPSIFTVTATGGVAPYTYSFTSTISGSQTGATYSITPATTGAGTIYAVVKDSAGNNITTSSFAFTITQGPTCGTPTTPACSTGGGSTPPPGYNAVTGLFMLAGLGIFAMVLIPGPIWIRVLGGVLIAVAGIVSGGFIGGWGWL
jgi:MYXO-CTERM domain-containing protein